MSTSRPSASDYIVPHCEEAVEIVRADAQFLLVNKPAGLLSVPGKHPLNRDCLISRLQVNYPEARIVHRLDLSTSGIMVVALGADSHRALSKQFEQRSTDKAYTAVVAGQVERDAGSIELPLICDWPNRPRQKVDAEHGKYALTHYQVLARGEDCTRLLLKPVTGRSHQLRVHTAAIGHPILGCEFYADAATFQRAERLLLHATTLSIDHPTSGIRITGHSPVPF